MGLLRVRCHGHNGRGGRGALVRGKPPHQPLQEPVAPREGHAVPRHPPQRPRDGHARLVPPLDLLGLRRPPRRRGGGRVHGGRGGRAQQSVPRIVPPVRLSRRAVQPPRHSAAELAVEDAQPPVLGGRVAFLRRVVRHRWHGLPADTDDRVRHVHCPGHIHPPTLRRGVLRPGVRPVDRQPGCAVLRHRVLRGPALGRGPRPHQHHGHHDDEHRPPPARDAVHGRDDIREGLREVAPRSARHI
mmetsp:Transcript_17842/g.41643  ORF Transcript_17842/g.41643 Transcript_17842/m.41643 type:complete len:243 (-) Transcript_17842:694-1422(-)